MVEGDPGSDNPEKKVDKFLVGRSIWINRHDGSKWKIVGTKPDGSGFVLENMQNPTATITKTEAELNYVPKQTVRTIPPITGTVDGMKVGNWEYGGEYEKK